MKLEPMMGSWSLGLVVLQRAKGKWLVMLVSSSNRLKLRQLAPGEANALCCCVKRDDTGREESRVHSFHHPTRYPSVNSSIIKPSFSRPMSQPRASRFQMASVIHPSVCVSQSPRYPGWRRRPRWSWMVSSIINSPRFPPHIPGAPYLHILSILHSLTLDSLPSSPLK